MSRKSKRDPVPFHASLDTPLLRFGTEDWCIRDACEATSILGQPGSAKTTSSGAAILRVCCESGMGGAYFCAKSDAADEAIRIAKTTSRTRDLVFIDASENSERFNILDYASRHLGGEGFEQNLIELMGRMIEATRQTGGTRGGGADGENRFFTDGALKWLSHVFPTLLAVYGTLRMEDVYRFLTGAPQTPAEALSAEWQQASYCYQTLAQLAVRAKQARATGTPDARLERVIKEHGDFFLDEAAKLDNRPRSSILSTLTNMIYPFLTGKLHDLFCTTTTITPRATRDGKIIVLNLPVLIYGAAGAVTQVLFKYLLGLDLQSQRVDDTTRPVFIFADEAQFFLNSADADLLATARSSKICIVYITQDLPTYYAKLGADSRDVAESILSKFGTRIFHANTSRETNQAASELIGKVEKFHVSETRSRGSTSGTGGNRHDQSGGFHGNHGANTGTSQSTSGYMDYEIPPDYFATSLRTGGPANRFKADAIVVRNGRNWKETGRHWIKAEFSQR
jgi:TraM recognition site of TraD and TraG